MYLFFLENKKEKEKFGTWKALWKAFFFPLFFGYKYVFSTQRT